MTNMPRHGTGVNIRALSIKRKLMLITMSTSTVALLLASIGFVAYDLVAFRSQMSDDLMTPFATTGMHDPAVGAAYRREILELPALANPTDAVRRFLGRDPSNDAYFRRIAGVSATTP